jgi:hypothetical protein
MRTNYSQRFASAQWFMLAGGIPGVCIILYDLTLPYRNPGLRNPKTSLLFVLFLYVIIPAFLAAISGLLIGADILNPNKVLSARQAAAHGLYVSLAAWVAFVPIVSLVMGPRDSNLPFLYKLSLVLLVGSIIIGWLIALAGTATGLFLYRFRKSQDQV